MKQDFSFFFSPPPFSLCHSLFSGYIIYMHYTLAGREEKKLLNQGLVNIYLCEKGKNLCKPRPPFFCPGKDHKLFFSLDFFEFRKKKIFACFYYVKNLLQIQYSANFFVLWTGFFCFFFLLLFLIPKAKKFFFC